MMKRMTPETLRSFVFGVEDSLVSTVGFVSGIAAVGSARSTIILTGVVLIFVEAFSMAVGELLSETSAKELTSGTEVPLSRSFGVAVVMLLSYILSGFLVLSPYLLFAGSIAFYLSIFVSLCALFILGIISARISRTHVFRKGITMAVVGGLAIVVGIGAGAVLQGFGV